MELSKQLAAAKHRSVFTVQCILFPSAFSSFPLTFQRISEFISPAEDYPQIYESFPKRP